jgi:prepilin-type N-terminal cleavage/methylation domain-containing protein
MRSKGFTLIELLIVVAIIAILAAIAVPNFLEAQVRSKVSRQKANMRTVATAMEAYYVDGNKYPLTTWTPFDRFPGGYQPSQWKFYPGQMTSPIAYISSSAAMEDIFRLPHRFPYPLANQIMYLPSLVYRPTPPGIYGGGLQSQDTYTAQLNTYGQWIIRSAGPDTWYQNYIGMNGDFGAGGWNRASYDATNGTVSAGDIMRSQKTPEQHHSGQKAVSF